MLFQLEKTKLASVAIPLPVNDPFTYVIPENLAERVRIGSRVLIPFKNREIVGYVVGSSDDVPPERAKKISALVDTEPILTDHLLNLTKWIGSYYFCSWGEAIQSALPKFYRKNQTPRIKNKIAEAIEEPKMPDLALTGEQAVAVQRMREMLRTDTPKTVLLFGVTGSGKTEVYIRMIKETIARGKSAICLVPEIALTEQIKRFFAHHFPNELEIVHSKLSEGERMQAWERIRRGEKSVVLGARSAIFSPFENLGLIIIDEEHEPSYKQDQTPRYHAKEVARWRSEHSNSLLILGTATPSIETMYAAESGIIEKIELKQRVLNKPLPQVDIIDLNQMQQMTGGNRVVISERLRSAIEQTLNARESVLLLLNRRGFSTNAQCLSCKKAISCNYCDVALTYHQSDQKLICHYCNYHTELGACPRCGESLLKFAGVGTEKVESEVARLFPSARVARLDSDSARRKGAHERILSQFREGKVDILVGTQMIAKGFDFPRVTLVGVVLADTSLILPDFRSSERTFQLMTQVAGRSGRGEVKGRVIVQTYTPFHHSIQHAMHHAVSPFFNEEIKHREIFKYPPFTQLINIIIRGKKEADVIEHALGLRRILSEKIPAEQAEAIGPAPLPFGKLRGNYRWHIILKSKVSPEHLSDSLRMSLGEIRKSNRVHIAVDVDPISIL